MFRELLGPLIAILKNDIVNPIMGDTGDESGGQDRVRRAQTDWWQKWLQRIRFTVAVISALIVLLLLVAVLKVIWSRPDSSRDILQAIFMFLVIAGFWATLGISALFLLFVADSKRGGDSRAGIGITLVTFVVVVAFLIGLAAVCDELFL